MLLRLKEHDWAIGLEVRVSKGLYREQSNLLVTSDTSGHLTPHILAESGDGEHDPRETSV